MQKVRVHFISWYPVTKCISLTNCSFCEIHILFTKLIVTQMQKVQDNFPLCVPWKHLGTTWGCVNDELIFFSQGVKDFILYCFCPWAPFILFIKFLLTDDGSPSISESFGSFFSFKLKCEHLKSNAIGVWSQHSNALGESWSADSRDSVLKLQGEKNLMNKWNQIRLEWVNLNYSPWSRSPLFPSPKFS